jgi:hypothetical protein
VGALALIAVAKSDAFVAVSPSQSAANSAVSRFSGLVDDLDGDLRLRTHGREKASNLLKKLKAAQ